MNDEGRPPGRPRHLSSPPLKIPRRDDGGLSRIAVFAALDALEAGDVLCVEQLLLDAADGPAAERPHRCPECSLLCAWPGELEQHRRVVHDIEPEELRVA